MFGWLSDANTSASRWKRDKRSPSAASAGGRILTATWRFRPRIGGAIDLPHAAFAEEGRNLVDTEPGSGGEGQVQRII